MFTQQEPEHGKRPPEIGHLDLMIYPGKAMPLDGLKTSKSISKTTDQFILKHLGPTSGKIILRTSVDGLNRRPSVETENWTWLKQSQARTTSMFEPKERSFSYD